MARLDELIAEIRLPLDGPPRAHRTRAARSTPTPRTSSGLAIGTVLERAWRGQTIRVEITADGVLHEGKTYSSLSACANAITGSHVSGNRFFGVKPTRRKA